VNERIRVPEVLVIDDLGVQLGVMPTREALVLAKEKGLDLVEVAATARPPVCKILDYGKLKYTKKKKSQEAKKKQSVVTVKEIQLRPRTEEHDLETKFRHIAEFLLRGDKVKISVMFRGREVAYAQQGKEMLERVIESVKEFAVPESYPKLEGRRMIMVLGPTGKGQNLDHKKVVLLSLAQIQPKTYESRPEPRPDPTPEVKVEPETDSTGE
jgi:translation initiation factor IF-3